MSCFNQGRFIVELFHTTNKNPEDFGKTRNLKKIPFRSQFLSSLQ